MLPPLEAANLAGAARATDQVLCCDQYRPEEQMNVPPNEVTQVITRTAVTRHHGHCAATSWNGS
jgi:hypothetical protein